MRCAPIKTLTHAPGTSTTARMRELGAPSQHTQFLTLFFFIMSKKVLLSLLAQGNNGTEILEILDVIVADIEQENIDSVAEVFAV